MVLKCALKLREVQRPSGQGVQEVRTIFTTTLNVTSILTLFRVHSGVLGVSSFKKVKKSEVVQSCPIFCDPMDCNLPGSSVHGIFQARVLEWVAISSAH